MDQHARGRHRRSPRRRSLSLPVAAAGAVVLVAAAAGTTAALSRAGDPGTAVSPTTTATVTATPSAAGGPAVVTGTRLVRERGGVVTVVEQLTVSSGQAVTVAPRRGAPDAALVATEVRLLAEDGTATPFTEPLTLGAGRTLTVVGTYRLLACPDLLPLAWPSPIRLSGDGWSRSWTRTSEPLRTAATLCPRAGPVARSLPGLTGRLASRQPPGDPPAVRVVLRWTGDRPLALDGVGALGGLAATVPGVGGGPACPRAGCLGAVPARGSRVVEVVAVESCPDAAPRSDRLTLLMHRRGSVSARLAAVQVAGLGRWLDRHVCR